VISTPQKRLIYKVWERLISMMKAKSISLILLPIFILIGCSNSQLTEIENTVESLHGYIFIKDETLYFDKVEIITREDRDRIKELGLNEARDYPSGYYIYNPTGDTDTFDLTEDTIYRFTDIQLLYVKETNGKRIYETTSREEFFNGSSYQNVSLEEQRIPYFIDIRDGKVVKITEEFIYTQ
jgi:hypothetical protein